MNAIDSTETAQRKASKISASFQRWLLLLVAVAFGFTVLMLWNVQTDLSKQNAVGLLKLNISDIRDSVVETSDSNLLELTHNVADELDALAAESPSGTNDPTDAASAVLQQLLDKYDVSEINIVNAAGIITVSTNSEFVGYDMTSGTQSREFMPLVTDATEIVQSYQPLSYDASIKRKYAGVALDAGGYVQVGYDSERFQRDIDSVMKGLANNRHVGKSGGIIISDQAGYIVSDQHDNFGQPLFVSGLNFATQSISDDESFSAEVYGLSCYCTTTVVEGYRITAYIPVSEVVISRNTSLGLTATVQTIVFALLFVLIYVLVRNLVVNNLRKVNGALSQIADGNLDVVVDVRSHEEFSSLSDDINSTVDTLKSYIADAEARVDTELQFAKTIQHSALPSVFPPYPNRTDFDIFAVMDTAREVGGDFYDFYFVGKHMLAFLIADVSGKGIPAAMFMMRSKTLLKSYAASGMSVEEVLMRANEALCENNEAEMFVTVWMGILNTKTGEVTFANAGHGHPVVKRANGTCEYFKSRPNLVLGGMEGINYRLNTLQLQPGDLLYLCTDGITEAIDTDENMYGDERLIETISACEPNVEAVCDAVKRSVAEFVGEAEQFDDITMLCLKYNGR